MTGLPVRPPLPVDSLLPAILDALRKESSLVLEAAPGAGKTTRVPPALLDLVPGEVLVLEPRRIAARLAALRVAAERGEQVGDTVGYQVRFEEVSGAHTRLRFLTEGVLTGRLLSDPDLQGVDAIVLDEFHERHLDTDLALALLRRLQERRPELKLVVMSATLDSAPVARFLGGCPVLQSAGRSFEVTLRYNSYSSLPLEEQVRDQLAALWREQHRGHVLVFLPGAAEIRRTQRACDALARSMGAQLLPLFGDLPAQEQDRALAPSDRTKVILATNIAESSVTIDGVSAVIDSGLARVASHSPWTGLPTLEISRINKASARQRAGRAGRTGPGTAIRLYPQEDFRQRPEHDLPALLREDLTGLCLALRVMGIKDPLSLAWLDTPPAPALAAAKTLLDLLGVTERNARDFARLPLPPRLARLVLEAKARKVAEEGIALAALLGTGTRLPGHDLLEALESPLDGQAERLQRQLRRLVGDTGPRRYDEEALLQSVLAGFPDRVARVRTGAELQLSNGTSAELEGTPPPFEFCTAVDVQDRAERRLPLVRLVARLEPEWLLDQFPERLREETSVQWNRQVERVETVSTLWYDQLPLEVSPGGTPDAEAAATLLVERAAELGLHRFVDAEELHGLQARLAFAGLPKLDLQAELHALARGLRSFRELREAAGGWIAATEARLGSSLEEAAPRRLRLPGGRLAPVHYEENKAPWVASRLQDFFGMQETPRLGRNKTAVVFHLLAPNQRAVQTTTDLRGFWERLYPQVRRELMRRYPRHSWPEDPLQAQPPGASTGPRKARPE